MLRTTSDSTTNKLILADIFNDIDSDKMIEEDSCLKSGKKFFIPIAKLAFANLRQAFIITLIL